MALQDTATATTAPRNSARADRAAYDLKRTVEWLEEQIAKGKKKRFCDIVTLNVPLAQLLVSEEMNSDNRPISNGNASSLMSDLANGRFEFNGESIKISDTGKTLDGQHRCYTVIETGIPIETVMVFGVKDSARFTIDTGRAKTAANFIAMQKYKNAALLAAAARLVLIYRSAGNLGAGGGKAKNHAPTKTEVVTAVGQLRGLEASAALAMSAPRALGTPSVIAFTHYVIGKKAGRDAADEFFTGMIEGADLRRGDPRLYCKNRLTELRASGGTKFLNGKAELIFKCWNYHRRGEQISKFPLNGRLPKVES